MNKVSNATKAITAWVVAQMAWASSVVATDPAHFHVTPALWVAQAGAWATAILTFFATNTPLDVPAPKAQMVDKTNG